MILTRLKEVEKLCDLKHRDQSEYEKVGFVSGCWDLGHFYHLNTFLRARAKCDFLLVGIDSDDLVHVNKGNFPGTPWYQRAWNIANACPVDAVVILNSMKDHNYICNEVDIVFKNAVTIYGKPVEHGNADLCILPDVVEVTSSTALKDMIVAQREHTD